MSHRAEYQQKRKAVLTTRQRLFAEAMLANGGNQTKAAMAAGTPKVSARVAGYRMAHTPKVAAYIGDLVRNHLALGSIGAVRTLVLLARSAKSEYVRLQAADSVLDRNAVGTQKGVPLGGVSLTVSINLAPPDRGAPDASHAETPGVEIPGSLEAKPLAHRVDPPKAPLLIDLDPGSVRRVPSPR